MRIVFFIPKIICSYFTFKDLVSIDYNILHINCIFHPTNFEAELKLNENVYFLTFRKCSILRGLKFE